MMVIKNENLFFLIQALCLIFTFTSGSVKIFGPGLSRFFEVPTRYFFISIEEGGRNLTLQDFAKGDLRAWLEPISTSKNKRIRAAIDILSTSELAGVVRFRLLETSEHGVEIHVTRKDLLRGPKEIEGSPIRIRGPLYHDDCYCPFTDMNKWYKALDCPSPRTRKDDFYSQIFADLAKFDVDGGINMTAVVAETVDRLGRSRYQHSFCHYAVVSNQIYRKCYGEHVGFKMFTDNILLAITRKVRLPDLEFISNLGDWPLSQLDVRPLLPLISWCGSTTTADIILPTYDITESTLHMLDRVTLDMLSVRGNTGPQWPEKIGKAFWRGRDSRQERLDLVDFSKAHPDLLDANLTHVFFFRDKLSELEPLAKTVSFFDFFKYKYQINIDGTVAAYRLPYLLAGDSLVLKQESTYFEHFYSNLKPWVHYVPIKHDLSDLEEMLTWSKNHEAEAQKMAKTAQEYAWNNLLPHHIMCYHGVLFEEYAKLLVTKPDPAIAKDNMELVEQPKDYCHCLRDQKVLKHGEL